ncbi:Eukaryotic translation initiation factor 5B [Apiospora sp. TS-2023a]
MPPKKGKKGKAADDWEEELGESIAPANGDAAPRLKATLPPPQKRKTPPPNREKRKKKGLSEDFVDPDANKPSEPVEDLTAKAPIEVTADDEFALPEKKGKGGKGGKQQPAKAAPNADDVGEDGRMLTKAEKEKLKKEREKQRKKEQAALKKKTAPAPKAEAAKPAVEEKKAAAPEPEAASSAAGKKGKKLPPHLAALQKQQEDLKRQREEAEKLAAEEKRRIEEEEQKDAEEEKRKEEERARKKQKEKERIEQLKKEGKFLTKAQKEEKARNERKLQQMLAAGIKVGPQDAEAAEEKKKTAADKRKRGKKVDEEKALAEAAERARQQAEAAAKEAEEKAAKEKAEAEAAAKAAAAKQDSDLEDDWEAAAASDEDVKDSWDADSDEEGAKGDKDQNKKELPSRSKPENSDSDSDSESEEDSSEDEEQTARQAAEAQRKKEAAERREKAHQAAMAARSKDNLRSPICCILGHVDTGKTKLLDKIRQTNVQEGEAGGITQQIGATYFPVDAIKQKTQVVNRDGSFDFKVPGLLVIDTPGHESFSNLRSRGSSLCNIAILVVDIMHGLEPQTLESMKLLRDRKTPFVVALNKIDRLYGWKKVDNNGFQESLALQNKGVQNEFKNRLEQTKVAFAEQGFNAELFYENKSMAKFVSLIPTSAHTGEGIPDMLKLILQLTQERMVGSLMYLSEVQATVLEVKAIEGFGMTIDVILSNGVLRESDRIVELRVKSAYVHNKEVKAAMGVKISAPGLEGAIAGSRLLVVGPDDDEDDLADEVEGDLNKLFSRVEKSGRGVTVQASTLGSLEALLDFLKDSKIPVANVGIGPVYKRDVMQCGTMLEKSPDFAVMLCFDVKVDKEASAYAEDNNIKIFTADIIYHLFDNFTKHMEEQLAKKKEESKMLAVFPCVLKPVAVFNKTNPIVVGVDVIEGSLRINTPIAAVKTNSAGQKEVIGIGRVTSIEREHKQIPVCKKGQPSVAVKIEMGNSQPTYGRQLEEDDTLYSLISRASIDTLKQFYRKDMTNDDWQLIIKLKPFFDL